MTSTRVTDVVKVVVKTGIISDLSFRPCTDGFVEIKSFCFGIFDSFLAILIGNDVWESHFNYTSGLFISILPRLYGRFDNMITWMICIASGQMGVFLSFGCVFIELLTNTRTPQSLGRIGMEKPGTHLMCACCKCCIFI